MTRAHVLVLFLLLSASCASPAAEETAPGPAPAVAQPGAIQVVPLQYASAMELEKVLAKALGSSRQHGLRIVADARTNSLVLTADSEAALAPVLELIAKLDVDTPKPPAEAPAEAPKAPAEAPVEAPKAP